MAKMFEAWTLSSDQVKAEEESLRVKVRASDEQQRKRFYHEYNHRVKDPDTYAVLNWLFLAGLHHFYLGKLARGSLNIAVMLVGLAMLFESIFVGLTLIILILVAELPALFRSQVVVADYNNRLGFEILDRIGSEH